MGHFLTPACEACYYVAGLFGGKTRLLIPSQLTLTFFSIFPFILTLTVAHLHVKSPHVTGKQVHTVVIF